MSARIASYQPRPNHEKLETRDQPDPQLSVKPGDDDATVAPLGREANTGKKFCEAGEGWCRVCEKMSDIPILRSEDLLQGRREVLVLHGNEVYRLLCTRNNKLILQK